MRRDLRHPQAARGVLAVGLLLGLSGPACNRAVVQVETEPGDAVVVVNDNMKNVPAVAGNDWPLRTPGDTRPEQFFYAQ